MRKLILAVMISVLLLGFSAGVSMADTILFPYINSNPGNLATIVSTINTGNEVSEGCVLLADTLRLHYRYFTKPVAGAGSEPIDACDERDFMRPTTLADIVSFDVSGQVGGGTALFGDATNYNWGAGAPNFDLPTVGGFADARRGYLLVTHHCAGVTNLDMHSGNNNLDGDAMLVDVVNGAAWGYRAVIADPALMGPYAFSPIGAGATPAFGMTSDLLSEPIVPVAVPYAGVNRYARNQAVPIYPPDDFQTRFMVTPLYIDTAASPTNNDMSTVPDLTQKRTRIRLIDRNGLQGVTDRDEQGVTGGDTIHVRCVAGIDLDTLTAGSFGAWWDAQGGWAAVDLLDPLMIDAPNEIAIGAGDYNAIVFKLEFGAPGFAGGSMINTATLIRDGRIW
ncbi:MAG: hypothetical protein A2Y97_03710 [Nitrospirae bacterium RBG_13_39_12]|nr:MAG: hypothetical protein A2Y97_03710 [Nitrospirae bacterium RBG_13_39_12]